MLQALSELAQIYPGYPFRGSIREEQPGEVQVIQLKNLDPHLGLATEGLAKVALPGRGGANWIEAGDVLFIARGPRNYAVHVGQVAGQAVITPHCFQIKVKEDVGILPEFLAWQINQRPAQRYFEVNGEGATLPSIRRAVLEALQLAVPPLAEQHKVLNFYRAWCAERNTLQALLSNSERLMHGIAEQLLHT